MFRLLKPNIRFVILLSCLIIFAVLFPGSIVTTFNILIKKTQLKYFEIQLEVLDLLVEERSIKVIEDELLNSMAPKIIKEKPFPKKDESIIPDDRILEPNRQHKLGEMEKNEAKVIPLEENN